MRSFRGTILYLMSTNYPEIIQIGAELLLPPIKNDSYYRSIISPICFAS